jgi:hypothetical protein
MPIERRACRSSRSEKAEISAPSTMTWPEVGF